MSGWRIIIEHDGTEPGGPRGATPLLLLDGAIDSHGPDGAAVVDLGGRVPSLRRAVGAAKEPINGGDWARIGRWRVRAAPTLDCGDAGAAPELLRPRLLVRTPDGLAREVTLPTNNGAQFVFGRSKAGSHIAVADRHVSSHHFRVVARDGRLLIEDLGSRHGTSVNGVRVTAPRTLQHQDVIVAGATRLEFMDFGSKVRDGESSQRMDPSGDDSSQETAMHEPIPAPGPDLSWGDQPTPVAGRSRLVGAAVLIFAAGLVGVVTLGLWKLLNSH